MADKTDTCSEISRIGVPKRIKMKQFSDTRK